MYQLSIVSPRQVVFEGKVKSVKVPGAAGSFEMLTDHAPIIALLKKGPVYVVNENLEKQQFNIAGGFVEFKHNQCTILADAIE
jgi:F-type H+-transporting ATPase subunit epsilon